MKPPAENNDLAALATALRDSSLFAPDPSWDEGPNSWRRIAQDGAAAASSGNAQGARASCKTCHKAWRSQYKQQFRARVLPGVPNAAGAGAGFPVPLPPNRPATSPSPAAH